MMQNVKVRGQRAGIRIADNHGRFLSDETELKDLLLPAPTQRQLREITHRDAVIILSTQHATETKSNRNIVAHHPLAVERLMNIQILGTSQTQSVDPLGREVSRLLMQIWNGSGIEAAGWSAGKAPKVRWEKGRCWCWRRLVFLRPISATLLLHDIRPRTDSRSQQQQHKINREVKFSLSAAHKKILEWRKIRGAYWDGSKNFVHSAEPRGASVIMCQYVWRLNQ